MSAYQMLKMAVSWRGDFIVLFFGVVFLAGIWIVASGQVWGWIPFGLAILAVLVRMFEGMQHGIGDVHVLETKLCPTCGGSGRTEKEEAIKEA